MRLVLSHKNRVVTRGEKLISLGLENIRNAKTKERYPEEILIV